MALKYSKNINEDKANAKKVSGSSIPDSSKSPFFMTQVEKAKETLKKYPIPLELLRAK